MPRCRNLKAWWQLAADLLVFVGTARESYLKAAWRVGLGPSLPNGGKTKFSNHFSR